MISASRSPLTRWIAIASAAMFAMACAATPPAPVSDTFTIAVIPDTQNMVSFKHQKSEGFAIDGGDQFLQEMQSIADWRDDRGRPLAFVIGVGDVWQHQSEEMDEDHRDRGFKQIPNRYFDTELAVTDETLRFEIPLAVKGYRRLADAGLPFGVAPGNHDHDAMWSTEGFPPKLDINPRELRMVPEHLGMLHIGGLNNFRSAFGASGEFYADKPWYVASHNGGGSSAQTFSGAGYSFLHIALEMQPSDDTISWALAVIDDHPNTPTIISTHDYLNTAGQRLPNPIVDLARVDPGHHNDAEALWDKLLSQRDEIFLVVCGHQHAQSRRVDANVNGHEVHQILADYQSRGQSAMDAGQPMDPYRHRPPVVGDGWFRLMEFDFSGATPMVKVRTWSAHYRQYSTTLPTYAEWYRKYEQPQMSDEEYLATDEFELALPDFRRRFGDSSKAK